MKRIMLPLTQQVIDDLQVGDTVLLSGEIITGRDAAHKRINQHILEHGQPPIPLKGATIYYVGPCPSKPNQVIGSCGPTTAYRCDVFTPLMLEQGLKGMIGKGFRSAEVIQSMIKNKCVYFSGIGGAGALYADCVKSAEVIAYADLGAEAVYKLYIEDLPVVVAIDCKGNAIFK